MSLKAQRVSFTWTSHVVTKVHSYKITHLGMVNLQNIPLNQDSHHTVMSFLTATQTWKYKTWRLEVFWIVMLASSLILIASLLRLVSLPDYPFLLSFDCWTVPPHAYICVPFPAPFTLPWRWRQQGPPKHWYSTATLCSITTQKTSWICMTVA